MKILPYYLEDVGAKYSGAISLVENMNFLEEYRALLISDYMERGIVVDEWLSNGVDIISKKPLIPTKTFSDGVYFWDYSHLYYVKNYRSRLPKLFIAHVLENISKNFSFEYLDKNSISKDFELIISKIAGGDESYYDGTF